MHISFEWIPGTTHLRMDGGGMDANPRRGSVRVTEEHGPFAVRYLLAWFESEHEDAAAGRAIEEAVVGDPVEALQWARERAPVVLVDREVEGGAYGAFSAGERQPPGGSLPALDETAMRARRPGPWPSDGEFAWSGPAAPVDPREDERWVAEEKMGLRDGSASDVVVRSDPEIRGSVEERLETALSRVAAESSPTTVSLRVALGQQGIEVGDNELLGAHRCGHVLLSLFDAARGRRSVCFLLLDVEEDGAIDELNVIDVTRTITWS